MNTESRPNVFPNPTAILTPALWRNTTLPLADITDHLAQAFQEKQELDLRLKEVVHQRDALQERLSEASGEIARLQKQLADAIKSELVVKGRQSAEIAVRERLIRDDVQREFQTLQIQLKRERHQLSQKIARMESDLSGCICRSR